LVWSVSHSVRQSVHALMVGCLVGQSVHGYIDLWVGRLVFKSIY